MGLALGPVSRLWTRALYRDILSAEFWSQPISLSPEAARGVKFWKDSLHHRNGRPIWDANPKIDVISYSDASNTGWGDYCVNIAGTEVSGSWSETESRESSTWRNSGVYSWYSCQWRRSFQGKWCATGRITSTWRTSSRWEAHPQNYTPRLLPSTLSVDSAVLVLNQSEYPRY